MHVFTNDIRVLISGLICQSENLNGIKELITNQHNLAWEKN